MADLLKVGLAQMAPVWLNRTATLDKIAQYTADAGAQGCDLVVFGEALLPGYPFWLSFTDGATFESPFQKELHAHYLQEAVQIERGDLDVLCGLAKGHKLSIYIGIIERPLDRGGHSVYASLVYIDPQGVIQSVHRKLRPTYEERLVWASGDGHGLRVHPLGDFAVGGLNCWENWLPLARTALYSQGENLHVAVWPGAKRNTDDITRFIAQEGRSYVISVSGLMLQEDIPADIPHAEALKAAAPKVMADGGSCLAGPDGQWIIKPMVGKEELATAEIDIRKVWAARQNMDGVGHYSRPDVTRLIVNRKRQGIVAWEEE